MCQRTIRGDAVTTSEQQIRQTPYVKKRLNLVSQRRPFKDFQKPPQGGFFLDSGAFSLGFERAAGRRVQPIDHLAGWFVALHTGLKQR